MAYATAAVPVCRVCCRGGRGRGMGFANENINDENSNNSFDVGMGDDMIPVDMFNRNQSPASCVPFGTCRRGRCAFPAQCGEGINHVQGIKKRRACKQGIIEGDAHASRRHRIPETQRRENGTRHRENHRYNESRCIETRNCEFVERIARITIAQRQKTHSSFVAHAGTFRGIGDQGRATQRVE